MVGGADTTGHADEASGDEISEPDLLRFVSDADRIIGVAFGLLRKSRTATMTGQQES